MATRKSVFILLSIPAIGLAILLLIPCLWVLFYFGIYLGYGRYKVWGHQEFAANGVSQIEPAMEMDRLYADCRHYITYGREDVPFFNSVAYFGGRYQLTMQVPVDIDSETSGKMSGEPQIYLNEIAKITVSPTGQIGASFSRNLDFRSAEWKQVLNADGDFGAIGFDIKTTPVGNFQLYADASRPSN